MTNPFSFIDSITYSKKNLIAESDNPELEEKGYSAFMINRGLSYFPDTVMYANEINQYYDLPNRLQYEYLLNIIRPKKRYSKWFKKEKSADLEFVMEYFGYNIQKARSALAILSKEEIKKLRKIREEGGVKNEPSR